MESTKEKVLKMYVYTWPRTGQEYRVLATDLLDVKRRLLEVYSKHDVEQLVKFKCRIELLPSIIVCNPDTKFYASR